MDNIYEKRLKDFKEEQDENKFGNASKLRFEDGVLMRVWFHSNRKNIFKSNDPISKEIVNQFNSFKMKQTEERKKGKFLQKLKEFSEETNEDKFLYNSNLKFEDDTIMFSWFRANYKKILEDDSKYAKDILEQYKKHKETYVKITPYFLKKMEEFSKINDIKKYSEKNRDIWFKDGTSANIWFSMNKKRLETLDNEFAIKIIDDFKKIRNKKYQFFVETNMSKFDSDDILFADKTKMKNWFICHKEEILSSDDEISLGIKKQYEEYVESKKDSRRKKYDSKYQERLRVFSEEEDLLKFNQLHKDRFKFESGFGMAAWFSHNKEKILSSNDPLSLKIQSDYKKYLSMHKRKRDVSKRISYEERLKEFASIESTDKYYNKKFKFKDGALTQPWFTNNKKTILNGTDEYSLSIKNDYLNNVVLLTFDEKVKEFCEMKNKDKFNYSFEGEFSDGVDISFWFHHNKQIIFSSNDKYSKKLKKQYEKHLLSYNKNFLNECKEFLKIEDSSKFKVKSTYKVNGVNSDSWFKNYRFIIFNSNNPLCLEIVEQYKKATTEYKRLKFIENTERVYLERLTEFEQINNNKKFYDVSVKFEDGKSTSNWFKKHACVISESTDDISLRILKQFEEYMNSFVPPVKYEDKDRDKDKGKKK